MVIINGGRQKWKVAQMGNKLSNAKPRMSCQCLQAVTTHCSVSALKLTAWIPILSSFSKLNRFHDDYECMMCAFLQLCYQPALALEPY